MSEPINDMPQVYDEYFKCSNERCQSVYHFSNFENKKTYFCNDCKTESKAPATYMSKGVLKLKK
jgi:hypothetical protein